MNARLGSIGPRWRNRCGGFTLIEVMMSLVVLGIGLMGVIGMLQWAERGLAISSKATQALSLAEARLETKQAGPWEHLLSDDLDQDGVPELHMQDDGIRDDLKSADGIFTASLDQDGIHLVWTVELNRVGPLASAGMAWIEACARYELIPGQTREIRVLTLRANPIYTGRY